MILDQCIEVILTIMTKKFGAFIVISAVLLNIFAASELTKDGKWASESNVYFHQIFLIEK